MPSESPGKIVENGYDRIYKQYDNYRKISVNRRELDRFLKLIPKGSTVLDIGCGSGRITKFLTDHDLNVVGIDISRNMLKLAEERTPEAEFLKQDMRKLDFPKQSFDGALALYSIIHVPRKYHSAIFKKIHRILRPKGIALLSVGGSNLENDIDENWMNWGARMHWSQFDLEKNLKLLRSGFKVLSWRLSGEKGDK